MFHKEKVNFEKKPAEDKKAWKNYPACKQLIVSEYRKFLLLEKLEFVEYLFKRTAHRSICPGCCDLENNLVYRSVNHEGGDGTNLIIIRNLVLGTIWYDYAI